MTSASSTRGSIALSYEFALGRLRPGNSLSPFGSEFPHQLVAQCPTVLPIGVPGPNYFGSGRVQPRNPGQPADSGIVGILADSRMVPADMRGQAAHGNGSRKFAMDEEWAALFQQVNEAIEAGVRDVGKPAGVQFQECVGS